jgi:hypothetical protein
VKSAADLVKVIRKSHSPLPVVVLENIVAITELRWVSRSLLWLETVGASNIGIEIKVVAVQGRRWLESLVVVSWVSRLSSRGLSWSLMVVIVSLGSECSVLGASDERSLSEHCSSQLSLHHICFNKKLYNK